MLMLAARTAARPAGAQGLRRAGVRARGLASEVAAAPAKTSSGGGITTSITWFTFGAAISGGAGYYLLMQDIQKLTAEVDTALADLRRDTLDSQKVLRDRLAQLEGTR